MLPTIVLNTWTDVRQAWPLASLKEIKGIPLLKSPLLTACDRQKLNFPDSVFS